MRGVILFDVKRLIIFAGRNVRLQCCDCEEYLEKLREVRYQPWYIYLTTLPRYSLAAAVTLTASLLAVIFIVIIATTRSVSYWKIGICC